MKNRDVLVQNKLALVGARAAIPKSENQLQLRLITKSSVREGKGGKDRGGGSKSSEGGPSRNS